MPAPWDRFPDETAAAWSAFQAYLELGTDRSLRRLQAVMPGRETKKTKRAKKAAQGGAEKKRVRGSLARWSKQFRWPERAAAWDRRDADQAALAVEAEIRLDETGELARQRAERRKLVIEEEFLIASALKSKALELLSFPTQTQTHGGPDGTQLVTEAADVKVFRAAGYLLKIAADLARTSVGLPVRVIRTEEPGQPQTDQKQPETAQDPVPLSLAERWRTLSVEHALELQGLSGDFPDDD